MLTGILKVLRLPPQCTFWRFLASLHLGVARQLLSVQRQMRERVWQAAHVGLRAVTLDTDTTVHTLFGQQMGGRKGYNPKNNLIRGQIDGNTYGNRNRREQDSRLPLPGTDFRTRSGFCLRTRITVGLFGLVNIVQLATGYCVWCLGLRRLGTFRENRPVKRSQQPEMAVDDQQPTTLLSV